jgi:diphthine synthase
MVLYIIGLGLGDEKDITVKGLEAIKSCEFIYLEHYTAILGIEPQRLEQFYGHKVILADRELVESGASEFLNRAKTSNVAFLVVGDPFGATTHSDLLLRAKSEGISTEIIHNASIMNAIGCCGLQLYNFGQTISIPFFTADWQPDSFYNKLKINLANSFHTLCLLDIKVKEQTPQNLAKNLKIYENPRYMTVNQAIEQLLLVEKKRGEKNYCDSTPAIGAARIGQSTQKLVSGALSELLSVDFGPPLHSLVICAAGAMHELEWEMWEELHWDAANRKKLRELKKIEQEEHYNRELIEKQRSERERKDKLLAEKERKLAEERESKKKLAEEKLAKQRANKATEEEEEEPVDIEPF